MKYGDCFFTKTRTTAKSELLCSSCGVWSPIAEWRETEVGCETCGEHSAVECPRCEEVFDHVYDELDVREAP